MNRTQIMLMGAMVALTLLAGGAALAAISTLQNAGVLVQDVASIEFPADELRTAKDPHPFELVNQHGDAVSLDTLRGKVVLLTAVYATCHAACPVIINQMKGAVAALTPEQQADLAIVAITLDPEGDTLEQRAMTANKHNLKAPLFNYVNGEDPAAVLSLVEKYGWARVEADAEGVIGHSNMFVLIDRSGKIAYTLSADRNVDWLTPALERLLAE